MPTFTEDDFSEVKEPLRFTEQDFEEAVPPESTWKFPGLPAQPEPYEPEESIGPRPPVFFPTQGTPLPVDVGELGKRFALSPVGQKILGPPGREAQRELGVGQPSPADVLSQSAMFAMGGGLLKGIPAGVVGAKMVYDQITALPEQYSEVKEAVKAGDPVRARRAGVELGLSTAMLAAIPLAAKFGGELNRATPPETEIPLEAKPLEEAGSRGIPIEISPLETIKPTEVPSASSVEEATAIHGNLRPLAVEGERKVPTERGGAGIQLQAERPVGRPEAPAPNEPAAEVAVVPEVVPEAQPQAPPPAWAIEQLKARGWDMGWPFVPADLMNPDFVAGIRSDPTIEPSEKARILSFAPGGKNEIRLEQPPAEPAKAESAPEAIAPAPEPAKAVNADNVQDLIVEYKGRQARAKTPLIKGNPRGPEETLSDYNRRLQDMVPVTEADLEFVESVPAALETIRKALGYSKVTARSGTHEWFQQTKNLGIIDAGVAWAKAEAERIKSKLAERAPEPAKAAAKEPTAEQEYDAARAAFQGPSRTFGEIQKAYRARKIGDVEFLAGKKAFDEARAAFDAAEEKFIAAKNKAKSETPAAAVDEGAAFLTKHGVKEGDSVTFTLKPAGRVHSGTVTGYAGEAKIGVRVSRGPLKGQQRSVDPLKSDLQPIRSATATRARAEALKPVEGSERASVVERERAFDKAILHDPEFDPPSAKEAEAIGARAEGIAIQARKMDARKRAFATLGLAQEEHRNPVAVADALPKILRYLSERDQPKPQAETLTLAPPESIAEGKARQVEETKALEKRQREEAAAEAARLKQQSGLGGDLGTAGQGKLFAEPGQQEIFQRIAQGPGAKTRPVAGPTEVVIEPTPGGGGFLIAWAKAHKGRRYAVATGFSTRAEAVDWLKENNSKRPYDQYTIQGEVEPTPKMPEGPGAKTGVASAKPEPPESIEGTGLKHAIDELERLSYGFKERTPQDRQAMGQAWQRAGDTLATNPRAGIELAEALEANPRRGLTGDESALLLRHKVGLENALNNAAEKTFSADPDAKSEGRMAVARLSDQLERFLDAVATRGSEWGREGRWRQALAYEDFTFATRERILRAKKGGQPLTEGERAKLFKEVADQKDALEKYEAYITKLEAKARQRTTETTIGSIQTEAVRDLPYSKPLLDRAAKFVAKIEKRYEPVVDSLRGKLSRLASLSAAARQGPGAKTRAGMEIPTELAAEIAADVAKQGSIRIAKGITDAAKWEKAMLEGFGPEIEPFLKEGYDAAWKLHYDDLNAEFGAKKAAKVAKAIQEKEPAKAKPEILAKIVERVEEDRTEEVSALAQKLARLAVMEGARGWRAIADAVHAELRTILPEIDYRDTLDMISGHGKFRAISTDPISIALAQGKSEMDTVRKLQEVIARQPAKRTGIQFQPPSDVKRRLVTILNEAKKKFGVVVTDPARQLKSALDARMRYYTNRIKDLAFEIKRGAKIVRERGAVPTSPELEAKKAEYVRLKAERDEIFKAGVSDEQRLALAIKAMERSEAEFRRRREAGEFTVEDKPKPWDTPEFKAAKARRDAEKAAFEEMRDLDEAFARHKEAGQLEELEKRSQILEEQINRGEVESKKALGKPVSPAVAAAREELAQLQKIKAQLRRAATAKTPEERALSAYKSRMATHVAELEERQARLEELLRTGDITREDLKRKPRIPLDIAKDPGALALKARSEAARNKILESERRAELKLRSPGQKFTDFFTKWLRREFVLSSPTSIAKLTAAAVEGLAFEPVKEAVGFGISKVFHRFAARTAAERPSSVRIEAKALAKAVTESMADAWQTLKTGKSNLETQFGGRRPVPEEMISYFGRLHAALKTPLKRAAFERVYAKLAELNIRAGKDASNPAAQMEMGNIAMREANRMLFLEDNRLVSAYRRGLSRFVQKDPATGKVSLPDYLIGGALNWLFPIVRIPTNLVARTIQGAVGFPVGATKLAVAYARGIDRLPVEHADPIMRQLKQGSIGGAVMLFGFLAADQIGGYYQPEKQRKPGQPKPTTIRIAGYEVPSFLLHHPLLELMQLGATVKHVADSKLRKKDTAAQGLGEGALAASLGLVEEVPFSREIADLSKLRDPNTRDQYIYSQIAGMTEPQALQWLARQMDKQTAFSWLEDARKRKPKGLWQNIEAGIPGLRETVPAK